MVKVWAKRGHGQGSVRSHIQGMAVFVLLSLVLFESHLVLPGTAHAASALSPRHTGMEPPGGNPLKNLPSGNSSASRTVQSGQGYTDAYGNTVDDRQPEERVPRQRPGEGAYGGYGETPDTRPLPNPDISPPAWSFR